MAERRRRNFTDEEDLALLREALGDPPFIQPRGSILARWDSLATSDADDSFPRENLSGKTASGRLGKLIKVHREHDAEAATLSGGSEEEESEKVMLLDELIALIDECTARTTAAKTTEGLKRQREEEALLAARRLTMETLAESTLYQNDAEKWN
ncbi:hypothetical protein GN958_ATG01692 [Phytophthora infestans]|uniref:Uncharacterized protein n=1 Tax=Phytophthora infestans TaxID=4787 RepID=A0A8S9V8F1_PHYIN|nr:hypothetical protein GN958_ATG01692 [Phytophthora infestans]